HVGDVALAEEGQEVVLAHRVKVDVLDHHHLVVLLGEKRLVQDIVYALSIARGEVLPGLGHARWRLLQALPRWVLAHLLQQFPDPLVHTGPLGAAPGSSKVLLSVPTIPSRRRLPAGKVGSSHSQKARARFSPVVGTPRRAATVLERS